MSLLQHVSVLVTQFSDNRRPPSGPFLCMFCLQRNPGNDKDVLHWIKAAFEAAFHKDLTPVQVPSGGLCTMQHQFTLVVYEHGCVFSPACQRCVARYST